MNYKGKLLILALCGLFIYACNSPHNPLAYETDAHGRGKTKILIEESFKLLFDTSIDTFESQFPKADIVPQYMAEDDIIKGFFENKAKTIVITREFTEKEIASLKSKQVEVRSDKIAIDAIAIIVNPANKDTMMTIEELKEVLSGKKTTWNSLKTNINVVYDQPNSANFNYLKNLCGEQNMNKSVFAVKSNEEVINYVKKNPSAMGIIGVNWISDLDDFEVLNFLDGIKVMYIAKNKTSRYCQPYSGFMYTQEYPLIREVWMINKGRRAGLNTGFVNYMVGETGQLIIQKASLVPAKAPVRMIQLTEE